MTKQDTSDTSQTTLDEKLKALGVLLRDRRILAGLSRNALAEITRVCACTIKLVETGRKAPTRRTCVLLVSAQILGLTWDDVAFVAGKASASLDSKTRDHS